MEFITRRNVKKNYTLQFIIYTMYYTTNKKLNSRYNFYKDLRMYQWNGIPPSI